ncbi:MAG TPA: PQQ-binding-like beta-propeller repeat protein [Planctomycetaceae bacterium]|nr:PQQ-binding-like beta-propeller repeat protein [Planctomycetaceae bacterium]
MDHKHPSGPVAAAMLALLPLAIGHADDWPRFRGPQGLGIGTGAGLPVTWSEDENIVWKTPLPGAGTSSPVVYGERVYLTAHTGYGISPESPGAMADLKRLVLCVNRGDGEILWTRDVEPVLPETEYGGRMHWHGYASSTPAVDDAGVYCLLGTSGVVAFDHEGNRLWRTSVGTRTHEWGSASSPVLAGGLVIVNAFVESGSLVALDKRTGDEVWRAEGLKESWTTPLLVHLPDGRQELVVAIWAEVLGFDPATGEQLWSCKGLDWYIVGSMVCHGDVAFCLAGKGVEATLAVRAGGRGDVSDTHVLWRARKGSNVSSPVFHDGYLYFAHESQGIAYCVDAQTGAVAYERRLPRVGEIYASPVVADGKLYYVSRLGGTLVLAARPEFELLGHNRMADDRSAFNASPAVSRGQILLRSGRFLYCVATQ